MTNGDPSDPAIPRKRRDPFDPEQGAPVGEELFKTLDFGIRMAGLIGVFVLFLLGAYYAIQVFNQLRQLITDPQGSEAAVQSIATLIDAEHLTLGQAHGEPVKLGRGVAYVMLLATYILWMWVPLGILSVTGRLLLAGLQRFPAPTGRSG